jgi:hypothetical protein
MLVKPGTQRGRNPAPIAPLAYTFGGTIQLLGDDDGAAKRGNCFRRGLDLTHESLIKHNSFFFKRDEEPMAKAPPDYSDAAERLLALVGAKRLPRLRLIEESGISNGRLVTYENGKRAPADAFAHNSEFSKLAKAFGLLPSALLAWWATGDNRLMPVSARCRRHRGLMRCAC